MAVELRAVPTERDFRGPGCTDDCRIVRALVPGQFGRSELMLHDPASHEAFGMAIGAQYSVSTLDIATGPLVVRLLTAELYVNGELATVSQKEWLMLRLVAERLGRLVPYRDIVAAMWPGETFRSHASTMHMVNVHSCRLRGKLGAASDLLVTKVSQGLILRNTPYTGPDL